VPERQNDLSISNSERLWRRIHPSQINWDTDPPLVSSGASNTKDGLSVSIVSETTIENLTQNYPEDSVVEFEVGFARSLGCVVFRDPTPNDPAHAIVWGPRAHGRMTQTQRIRFETLLFRCCSVGHVPKKTGRTVNPASDCGKSTAPTPARGVVG